MVVRGVGREESKGPHAGPAAGVEHPEPPTACIVRMAAQNGRIRPRCRDGRVHHGIGRPRVSRRRWGPRKSATERSGGSPGMMPEAGRRRTDDGAAMGEPTSAARRERPQAIWRTPPYRRARRGPQMAKAGVPPSPPASAAGRKRGF